MNPIRILIELGKDARIDVIGPIDPVPIVIEGGEPERILKALRAVLYSR